MSILEFLLNQTTRQNVKPIALFRYNICKMKLNATNYIILHQNQ